MEVLAVPSSMVWAVGKEATRLSKMQVIPLREKEKEMSRKLAIGTLVQTKPTTAWLKGCYAGQRAFISERSRGPVEYELLFECGQSLAWYERREFDVLEDPPSTEAACTFIKWLNQSRR